MPICTCEEAGCGILGGRNVDRRTQKEHIRVDQLAHFQRAQSFSQLAISEEQEAITRHIASLALSDESMVPESRGGRLWNGSEPWAGHHSNSSQNMWQNPSQSDCTRSVHSRTRRLLHQLADMDAKINTLDDGANSLIAEINLLGVDRDRNILVNEMLSQVTTFEDDLLRIESRKPSVNEARRRLEEKLNSLYEALTETLSKAPKQNDMGQSPRESMLYLSGVYIVDGNCPRDLTTCHDSDMDRPPFRADLTVYRSCFTSLLLSGHCMPCYSSCRKAGV